MRIADFPNRFNLHAIAETEGASRPLSDPVDDEDRCTLKGRRVKATCGMGHMVLGHQQARALAESRLDVLPEAGLGTKHPTACRSEMIAARWCHCHRIFHDAVERKERIVVEDNAVQFRGLDESLAETVIDGMARKARVMLLAREPLFLRRGNDYPIPHDCSGGVMVIGRNAQDVSHLRAPIA